MGTDHESRPAGRWYNPLDEYARAIKSVMDSIIMALPGARVKLVHLHPSGYVEFDTQASDRTISVRVSEELLSQVQAGGQFDLKHMSQFRALLRSINGAKFAVLLTTAGVQGIEK